MKNLLYALSLLLLLAFSSCLYDKGEDAQPNNGCDTTYYALTIKPIIDNNCAKSGCHVAGGTSSGNFTTYAGIKPYIDSGSLPVRINLDPSDALHMPKGAVLDSLTLATLNTWIADGYTGCD